MSKNLWIMAPRRRALALAGGLAVLCGVLGGCGPPEDAAAIDDSAGGLAIRVLSGADDEADEGGAGTESAMLTLSATELRFRERCPGGSGTKTLELSNTGSSSLTIRTLPVSGRAFSLLRPPALPARLSSGERLVLTVRFRPPVDGPEDLSPRGTLVINSSDSSHPSVSVALRGTVSSMQFSFSPSTLDFDTMRVGQVRARNLVLRNTGVCALEIGGIEQSGDLSDAVLVGELGDSPIGAGDDRDVEVIGACSEVGTINVRVRFFTPLDESLGTVRVRGLCRS